MIFGVNYTAVVGAAPYVDWATFSAMTAKTQMPDIRTSVYTNAPDLVRKSEWGKFVDDILEAPDYKFLDCQGAMIDGILASEKLGYDVTLFTGAATVFCGSALDKMEVMGTGKFDLALTLSLNQWRRRYPLRGVHPGFSLYRDGVLIFPWNDAVREFMTDWRNLWRAHRDECGDSRKAGSQYHPTIPPLNEALYRHSNLRLMLLPNNYCMTFWTGCVYGQVVLMCVHGSPGPKTLRMAKILNREWKKPRLYKKREIIG